MRAIWRPVARPVGLLGLPLVLAGVTGRFGVPVAGAAGAAFGQPASARVDAGSFTLLVNGQRAGREQLSIQRAPGADGVALEVRSESAVGDRRVALRIEADAQGAPVRYALDERRGTTIALRIAGQRQRGRFATQTRTDSSEAAREFLTVPGAVILDDEGIAQYALLLQGPRPTAEGASRAIPIVAPRGDRQGSAQLTLESQRDSVAIDGIGRPAWRWRLVTDREERQWLWSDADGRLLRLSVPARQLDARRDEFPRTP